MTNLDLRALRRRFPMPSRPAARTPSASAVLMPLVPGTGGDRVLYTIRSADLAMHAGEVSFPGGRIEPGDATPLAAALRETHEELGLPASAVEVVGHLADFRTFRDTYVHAYIGVVREEALRAHLRPNEEVERALLVPLADLRSGTAMASAGDAGAVPVERVRRYEARELPLPAGDERVIHYWRLSGGATLWGITGHLTALFLGTAFGWEPPARPVRTDDWLP